MSPQIRTLPGSHSFLDVPHARKTARSRSLWLARGSSQGTPKQLEGSRASIATVSAMSAVIGLSNRTCIVGIFTSSRLRANIIPKHVVFHACGTCWPWSRRAFDIGYDLALSSLLSVPGAVHRGEHPVCQAALNSTNYLERESPGDSTRSTNSFLVVGDTDLCVTRSNRKHSERCLPLPCSRSGLTSQLN